MSNSGIKNLSERFSGKQNLEYLLKLKNGDKSAEKELIDHNLRLVSYRINKRFYNVNCDKDDLFQIGAIGLTKAIKTFDCDKCKTLATYAVRCIDNEILMFIRKIKKDNSVESLQIPIINQKGDNNLTLEELLEDESIDFVDDYEKKEKIEDLLEVLDSLENREKEIIKLYFGIGVDKNYTQREISVNFGISQSYVSRVMKKGLRKLKEKMLGKEKLSGVIKDERKNEKMQRKNLKTIYQYFDQYSKEEIDEMLKLLTAAELAIINLRYGEDLEHPVTSPDWTKVHQNDFYGNIVPKMRRLLAKKRKLQGETSKEEKEIKVEKKTFVENKSEAKEEEIQKDVVMENQTQEISKEDYVKILKTVKTPLFNKMVGVLNPKEAMIVSLKLGFVDDKYFSTEAISNFLGIEEDEVREITSRVLKDYKKQVVSRIDRAIDFATDKDVKILEKTPQNV